MESSWRLNVWRYGLANLGITLAAEWLPPTGRIITNGKRPGANNFQAWQILPDRAPGEYQLYDGVKPPGSHFPYGYLVDPDFH